MNDQPVPRCRPETVRPHAEHRIECSQKQSLRYVGPAVEWNLLISGADAMALRTPTMQKTIRLWALAVAMVLAATSAHAAGRIVVAHDEWPLSESGFDYSADAAQFARNIATFFTGGQPGRFLVYSPNWGLTGNSLATTMSNAGHEWIIIDPNVNTTVDLYEYDAVFVGQVPIETAKLFAYVMNGGGVYLMAGTGYGVADSEMWKTFVNAFGLDIDGKYNNLEGLYPVNSTHELFTGVSSLLYVSGNDIRATGLVPGARIVQTVGTHRIFAVYADASMQVPTAINAATCGEAVQLRKTSKGQLGVHFIGTAWLTGEAFDPLSARLIGLGLSPVKSNLVDQLSPPTTESPGGQCNDHTDGILDLQVKFDMPSTVKKIWSLLGNTILDGQVLTLTISGNLKPEYGGTPVGSESTVILRTR
jgi:hypothetical protein